MIIFCDVFRLNPHADKASREVFEAWDSGHNTEYQWSVYSSRIVQDPIENTMGEDLECLRSAHRFLSMMLDLLQAVGCQGVGTQRFRQDVGGCNGILQRDVDSDASNRRHGVRGVANTEQSWRRPLRKPVDLYGEQLDLVPGIDLIDPISQERHDPSDAVLEVFQTGLLQLRESAFRYQVSDLEVVDAIDEDDQPAIVDVAEYIFRVAVVPGNAQPENVDGHTGFNEREVGCLTRGGMASIAAYRERCWNLDCALWRARNNAGGDSVALEKVDYLPAHTEREGWKFSGFGCKKIQEIPLRHQGDVLGARGQMREVCHRDVVIANATRRLCHLGVTNLQKLVEKSKLVEKFERGRVNGVSPKVPEKILMLFKNGNRNARTGQEKTEHDASRTAADDATGCLSGGLVWADHISDER